jgi:hypothetical protein
MHSDQGWQYQMNISIYKEKELYKVCQKGNCLDNAIIENSLEY